MDVNEHERLSNLSCVVLLCVFTFWVPCCDVRYDIRIKTMIGTFLLSVVCRRVLIYIICVCLCIVVTLCGVFLIWFSSCSVPCVASFSGLSIFECSLCILLRLFTFELYMNLSKGTTLSFYISFAIYLCAEFLE